MKSLKEVYRLIQQTKGKINLKDKLTVYRGINLETEDTPTTLARGDILSTGIKLEDAFKFLLYYPNNHLYVIEVEAGTNVLVTPYALVLTYPLDEDQLQNIFQQKPPDILKVKRLGNRGEEEVILFQSELEFDEIMFKVKYLEDYEHPINTHYIKAYPKRIIKEVKK